VEVASHVEVLRLEGERMAEAAAAAGPAAPVPTCPEWVVRDLVRHTGGIHRWATGIVATPRTEVWAVGLDEVVGTWSSDGELIQWFRAGHADLLTALEAAPADLECWTFLRGTSPLAHWARRQAHETTIHRVDAERAAGSALSPIAAAMAADGVDELLCGFVPRRSTKLRSETPSVLRVRTSDGDGDGGSTWVLRIDPDGVTATRVGAAADHDDEEGAGSAAAELSCTVSGTAEDLYLALWNRGDRDALTTEGDEAVLALFLDSVHVR
jgi:uncharacterized protein (TIGR03083 family)